MDKDAHPFGCQLKNCDSGRYCTVIGHVLQYYSRTNKERNDHDHLLKEIHKLLGLKRTRFNTKLCVHYVQYGRLSTIPAFLAEPDTVAGHEVMN